MKRALLTSLFIIVTLLTQRVLAAEWQWSVVAPTAPTTQPIEKREQPRAFLWIPPNCKQVRGVVFGQHNMEEEPILEHPVFRKALADLGFAEVWVAPGFDAMFRFDQGAGDRFDAMMKALADESGYPEIAYAALVPIGHSAAASMPWYIAAWKPDRVLACISFSGQWPYVPDEKNAPQAIGRSVDSVPGIVTIGEYEWADERMPEGGKIRVAHPTMPLSALGCPADGHFMAMDEKVEFLAFYLKKAVEYRLPKDAPTDRAPVLNSIDATKTGWLADRYRLNKDATASAAPVADYKGDPTQAFWYFDEETVRAVEAFQAKHRGKPVLLGYSQNGAIVPQVNGTHQQVTLKFLPGDDGITFKLVGEFLDTVPDGRPTRWAGQPTGSHIDKPAGGPPIEIRKITGPIKKISDDTWQLDQYRGSILNDRRGNDAWLIAIWPGNGEYKRMVQQSVLRIPRSNDKGSDQTITFPELSDVRADAAPIKLNATATSGMQVRYFVREGPAEIDGDTIKLTAIPPKAKWPVKVTVVAWQWGRSIEPKVKTAPMVMRTLNILGPGGATPRAARNLPPVIDPNAIDATIATSAAANPIHDRTLGGIDDSYQWSIPVAPEGYDRRAYLWIPPGCKRVKGLVFGLQNMLEKPMFQDVQFRKAVAAAQLGILWITPGAISKEKDPPLSLLFPKPKEAIPEFEEIAAKLAEQSGYSEVKYAPLLIVGHSAATPFVWGFPAVDPSRVFGMLAFKGWFPGHAPKGIPIFHVSSEWAEVGNEKWGITWSTNDRNSLIKLRQDGDNVLLGEAVELGVGHFHWNEATAPLLGRYIQKVAAARIPDDAPTDAPVKLKPMTIDSGVLVDPVTLGTPQFKAFSYNDYPGEKKLAYWYLDAELATAVNDFMAGPLAKKPQVIAAVENGKPTSLEKKGMGDIGAKLLPDGITFKAEARFLDEAPPQLGFPGPLGHADGPIQYKVSTGALKQVGPDTFRVWIDRGNIERQGDPWEPWVMAYHPGDSEYRGADRPIHFWISLINKDGRPQKIDFAKIPDQPSSQNQITLNGTSDSGLPVQFFVVSGPVALADDNRTLRFLPIPPRSAFPIRVRIGAYQWGRASGEKIQSVGPVFQEFLITK